MQDDAACLNEGSSNATNHAKEVGFDHLRQTPSSLRLFQLPTSFEGVYYVQNAVGPPGTSLLLGAVMFEKVSVRVPPLGAVATSKYIHIIYNLQISTNYSTNLHTPKQEMYLWVWVRTYASGCTNVSQCAFCILLLCLCVAGSPFTSCNILMCFKNGCFAMLCWHGWREQLSKSDQFSQQVSVPKLVLSTFTSVLRGTICSSCHARPQNLTGHLNGG